MHPLMFWKLGGGLQSVAAFPSDLSDFFALNQLKNVQKNEMRISVIEFLLAFSKVKSLLWKFIIISEIFLSTLKTSWTTLLPVASSNRESLNLNSNLFAAKISCHYHRSWLCASPELNPISVANFFLGLMSSTIAMHVSYTPWYIFAVLSKWQRGTVQALESDHLWNSKK